LIKSGDKPLPGQAFVTKPGQLSCCSHVIHAVVGPWRGGRHSEEDLLFTAVSKSLDIAAAMKMSSVALAGVDCCFPASAACQTVLDAVAEFQTQAHHFTEISLVDSRDQTVNHFHENLARHFGKQLVEVVSGQSADVPIPNVSVPPPARKLSFHLLYIGLHRVS